MSRCSTTRSSRPELPQRHRQTTCRRPTWKRARRRASDPESVPMADITCPDCGTKGPVDRAARLQHDLKTYPRPDQRPRRVCTICARRRRRASSSTSPTWSPRRAKPPLASARSARASATRSPPRNFIFRTREFEQMEMEFFVEPDTAREWHQYWIDTRLQWYVDLGIDPENLRALRASEGEAVVALPDRTVDIEYRFGFQGNPWVSSEGRRQPHRLRPQDALAAFGHRSVVLRPGQRYPLPPTSSNPQRGLTCSFMAFLVDAYAEDEAPNAKGGVDKRTVLAGSGWRRSRPPCCRCRATRS